MAEFDEIGEGPKVENAVQTAKDLFAGAVGGIAQVIIGQPFDIVKVRLQTTTQYSSAIDCASKIWKNEGPLAFYKGTLTPLIGIGACVSVQFGGFHFARRWFEARNSVDRGKQLSLGQYYAAGAFAGVVNSALSGPIEHVRIRLQTQPHAASRAQLLYPNPWACIRTLVSQGGITKGLYRGQAVTILREAQAYGCWFLTYEYLMAQDVARRGLSGRAEVEAWRLALYGGIAGEVLWLSSYPLDVIKSKMQTDGLGVADSAKAIGRGGGESAGGAPAMDAAANHFGTQKYKSMRDCFGQTWRLEGVRGFWKGIVPTMVRAMPVSAATFAVKKTPIEWPTTDVAAYREADQFFRAEMTLRLIS